ncbi:MAG: hypothetical protein ACRC4X_05730 [Cetobacterium sp.]
MKKLLTLLSLALTVSAFGAPTGNKEESAKMKVTATVIRPLTIAVAQDMDFGTIIQGAKADATGTYTLAGEPGAKIDITTTFPNALSNGITKSSLPIELVMGMPKGGYSLDEVGNLSIDVKGSVNPTANTETGTYTGTLVARVQYQ